MFVPDDETSSASGKPENSPLDQNFTSKTEFRRSKTDLHLTPQSFHNYQSATKNTWGKPRIDSQLKMRLYQWAPKRPMKTSPDGNYQYANRAPCMLEKSNSAHEISSGPLDPKPLSSRDGSDGVEKVGSEVDLAQNLIEFLEKTKTEQKRSLSDPSPWKPKLENKRWVLLPKPDPGDEEPPRNHPVASIIEEEADLESGIAATHEAEDNCLPREKTTGRKDTAYVKAGLATTKKPSEIPLRRTTPPKRPKPVSLLMQKPLDEVDSNVCIDLCPEKKCISIREFGPEPELPTTPNEDTREKEYLEEISEERPDLGEEKKVDNEDVTEDLRLNRCIKSSNIPVGSEPTENPADWKLKKLDLEKVKSSSLILLNSDTLSRLESLHQQNLSTKESSAGEKSTAGNSPSKVQMLGPKSSFNALRGKGSKKNLSARLSSKGNKPALKTKAKVKKEPEGSFLLQKKKSSEESSEAQKKRVAKAKGVTAGRNAEKENPSGGVAKANVENSRKIFKKPRTVEGSMELRGVKTPAEGVRKENSDFDKVETPKSVSSVPVMFFEKQSDGDKPPSSSLEGKEEETPEKKSPGGENTESIPDPPPVLEHPEAVIEAKLAEDLKGLCKSFIITTSKEKLGEKLGKKKPEEEKPEEEKANKSFQEKQGKNGRDKVETDTWTEKKPKVDNLSSKKKKNLPQKGLSTGKSVKLDVLEVRGTGLSFIKKISPLTPSKSEENNAEFQNDPMAMLECGLDFSQKPPPAFDWLYMSPEKCNEELYVLKESSNDSDTNEEDMKEESLLRPAAQSPEPVCADSTNSTLKKGHKSSSSLKRKLRGKTSTMNVKATSKKKLRSDAGDRRPAGGYFNSAMSFKNKGKPDTKLRSGLTKSYREVKVVSEKKDLFEDTSAVKLRRRNSEPHSFRGFVWKRADLAAPRTNKTSASSMASSLRHLNTDELEDFIFWEVIPQKVTQCWETSLYHFKRPWSVLSCSVFQDNRESSTPGLILANLRNGGAFASSKRPTAGENERLTCPTENSFDVEPSIAQKNIDIRNWLAALNFPTIPSTSTDIISEGSCCSQSSIVAVNWSKNQVSSPKRRNVLTGLKVSDEVSGSKPKNAGTAKDIKKWDRNDANLVKMIVIEKTENVFNSMANSHPKAFNGGPPVDNGPEHHKERKKACRKVKKGAERRKIHPSLSNDPFDPSKTNDWPPLSAEVDEAPEPPPSGGRLADLWELCKKLAKHNLWMLLFIAPLLFFTIYFAFLFFH